MSCHDWIKLARLSALVAAAVLASLPVCAEGRHALVIGNNSYVNLPADEQLAKATNDANAVGDTLQHLGFSVTRAIDLGRAELVDALFQFSQSVKPGDTAVIYYAGHGVAINGANYLLPTDIPDATAGEEQRIARTAIAEVDIINDIQAVNPRLTLLVMDACRNNPFKRAGTRSLGSARGLARLDVDAGGLFAIYSASVGQEALDTLGPADPNPNSVFTRVFVKELAKTDKTLNEVAVATRSEVVKLAKQVMDHDQRPGYYDELGSGPPYLLPQDASPSPAAMPQPAPPIEAVIPPPAAPPLVAAPAEKDVWEMARSSQDAGIVREFLFKNPTSRFRDEALKLLAALQPPPAVSPATKPAPPAARKAIVAPRKPRLAKPAVSPKPQASTTRAAKPQRGGSCFTFNGQSYCE